MDNKDIKMLKLLFDRASSDGERTNIINMLNKKYNYDIISHIINQPYQSQQPRYEGLYREGYNMFKKKYQETDNALNDAIDTINQLMMRNAQLKVDNEKLNADLYYAKFCAVFWFMLMIMMGIVFIIL